MVQHEFVRFLAVGGVAALLNWASRIVLSNWLSLEIAVVVAHLIGMVFAYLAGRTIAFKLQGGFSASEFGRFALVNVVSLAQTWIVTIGISRLVLGPMGFSDNWDALAHAAGIGSTAITSYFLHRQFTFAHARRAARNETS